MRCSKCGKEFGEDTNCQHCGVDRVTGLANYNGYGTSDYQGANTSHYDSSYNSSPKTMVCYACSEIIPSDSEYCPHCRKKLYETCPNCGHRYSSQYSNCNQCGTNRKEYYEQKEKERRAELERQKKEQEERVKKEQEQIEAIKLRDNLKASKSIVTKCGIFLGVLSILMVLIGGILIFSEDYIKEFFPSNEEYYSIALSLFLYGVIIFILACFIVPILGKIGEKIEEKRTQHNVSQWKQEHPNDPRSKYL